MRGGVRDSKALNSQLADILAKAKDTYKELDKDGEVTTVALAKEINTETVSPSFMVFARERVQMIYDSGGWRNWRKYCGLINKLDAFRKKRRMSDITVADLTVDMLTRFDNFLHNGRMNGSRESCCTRIQSRCSSTYFVLLFIGRLRSVLWRHQKILSLCSNTRV